jgi:hypothetical protein
MTLGLDTRLYAQDRSQWCRCGRSHVIRLLSKAIGPQRDVIWSGPLPTVIGRRLVGSLSYGSLSVTRLYSFDDRVISE